jgi:hypothetical protein
VLGAEYVDKRRPRRTISNPFTELLNTYCWNDVWNRPGLERKTRSMLNWRCCRRSAARTNSSCTSTARSTTA